ncbi:MAG: AsmA family protein [Rhodospirillaceae bacterium]|nr:AsmA family protein [Rhodospirillaceae bacterium]
MRRLLIALPVVLVFFALIIVFGPTVMPQPTLNKMVAAVIEQTLDHPVAIAGDAELTLFPTFRLNAKGVSARALTGGGKDTPALFDVGAVTVEIDAVSLLYNRVRVNLIRFDNPVVRLHVDADGQANWRARKSQQPEIKRPQLDRDWGWWNEFDLSKVELRGGRLLMVDRTRNWRLEAERIGLASSKPLNTTSGPGFALAGSARINDEPFTLRFETGAISKVLAGGRIPVVFDMQGAIGALRYQGAAAKRQVVVSEGSLSIRIPDFPRFQRWLGRSQAGPPTGGGIKASAQLDISGDRLTVSNIDLGWPGGAGRGDISASLRSDGTLALDGELHMDTLDLSALGGEAALAGAAAFLPEKLIGRIKVDWQKFVRSGLRAGAGKAQINFTTGAERWSIEASTEKLYGGRGQANIRWGIAEGMASLKAAFRLSRVNTEELLTGLAGNSPIEGTANVSIDLFSVGGTSREMLAALGGKGRFNVTTGTLLDPGIVRRLSDQQKPLPFSQLLGSFRVGQGIVRTDDVLLRTAGMSLVGAGEVDLAESYVNIDLRSIARQNNSTDRPAIKPFRIEGPLTSLSTARQ